MTKYRLYVDEVGDTGLKRVNLLDHRFLSLTGVIAESDYVRRRIHPELEAIKVRYFDSHPDEPVVLHRREMVNGRRPFQALADTETRAAFDNELLGLLSEWDCPVITVLSHTDFGELGSNADAKSIVPSRSFQLAVH